METKKCNGCKEILPTTEFKRTKQGYLVYCCVKCINKKALERYFKNKERKNHRVHFIDGVEKSCSKCKEIKPLEQFCKSRYDRTGFASYCRVCSNALKRTSEGPRKLYKIINNSCECSTCGIVKPMEDFYKCKTHKRGYQYDCKECVKARHKERVAKNRTLMPVPELFVQTCKHCNEAKFSTEFTVNHQNKSGINCICRKCAYQIRKANGTHYKPKVREPSVKPNPLVLTEKICSKCKELKPIDAFKKNKQQSTGRHPSCKDCNKQVSKDYYEATKWFLPSKSREYVNKVNAKRLTMAKDPELYIAKVQPRVKAYEKKRNEELTDCVLRARIKGKNRIENAPKEMIDLKRQVILAKRLIKEISNG